MAQLIQIKRSLNTSIPASLANGELAITANGDVLYIGSNSTILPVAGKRTPGVLTANQAIVTNSTNMIDKIMIGNSSVNAIINDANLVLSNSSITLSIGKPTSGQQGGAYYLKADGSWSTVTGATADPAGANTDVQYNDSGTMNGSDAFTYNETTNTVFSSNTFLTGNSTVNSYLTVESLRLQNSTVVYTVTKPTAAQVSAADYYLASDSSWKQVAVIGDLDDLSDVTISSAANNNILVFNNGTSQWENKAVGNGVAFWGSQVLALVPNNGIVVNAGGVWVKANNGISVTTDGVLVNPNNGIVVNTYGVFAKQANGISVDAGGINVNVATTSGLVSNTTGVWITANGGLLTNATGLHIGQGNGMAVDADAIRVVAGSTGGLISNSTGIWVAANNGLVANSTGLWAKTGSTLTVNADGIHVNSALSITDLTLTGNLSVSGTLVTVDAVNLTVNDSIIALARNNAADTLDIGFYGQYNDGTERFTGLIWDTTDNSYYLFANTTAEPDTTVNISGTGFVKSLLRSYIDTGALVANLTSVYITANSTVNVNITANTLTLSSALAGTGGGTGLTSIANNALLLGNSTNGYNALTIGADGTVLQCNSTHVYYGSLDGGTF